MCVCVYVNITVIITICENNCMSAHTSEMTDLVSCVPKDEYSEIYKFGEK
jgi:hypothetical protein